MQTNAVSSVALAALAAFATLPTKEASGILSGEAINKRQVLNTRFTYKAVVPETSSKSPVLEVWLPIPSGSPLQKINNFQVKAPCSYRITQEKKYGNRMVFLRVENPKRPFEVTVNFDVESLPAEVLSAGRSVGKLLTPQAALKADSLVPVGTRYKQIANDVMKGTSTLDKMRSLYEHVVASMQYDYKKESPKLGQGDVAFVCDYKKGNCSDLHSYLISLARSVGIPVILEYGFPIYSIPFDNPEPTEGKIGGYHCWLWFYDSQRGWVPLDASDGRRWLDKGKPKTKEFLFGNLVLERSAVAISHGRDIVLNPPQKGEPLNNFIYPYAELGGKEAKVNWELTYKVLHIGTKPANAYL